MGDKVLGDTKQKPRGTYENVQLCCEIHRCKAVRHYHRAFTLVFIPRRRSSGTKRFALFHLSSLEPLSGGNTTRNKHGLKGVGVVALASSFTNRMLRIMAFVSSKCSIYPYGLATSIGTIDRASLV